MPRTRQGRRVRNEASYRQRLRSSRSQPSESTLTGQPQDQDVILLDDTGSCIDLTSSEDDDFVDLTRTSSVGDNNEPVVLLTPVRDSVDLTVTRRPDTPNVGANDQSVIVIETPEADDSRDSPMIVQSPPRATPSISSTVASPDSVFTCPVCFDEQKLIKQTNRKLTSTKCGHVFCNVCIYRSISINSECPTCRKRQRKSDLRVLHM